MARTNTELYRRFSGTLRPRALRFLPLVGAGVRTATKRKLPLLLLYAPPAIATIVFSFVVYGKYAAEQVTSIGGIQGMARHFAQRAIVTLDVKTQIVDLNQAMQLFSLLTVAWYGAGLFAEDKRLGAHLLYFSRPLTRLDYFLGKFFVVSFFGALTVLAPGLVVCFVAAWASPEWSFLKEEGDLIWRTCAYSAIWITLTSTVMLCASALASRRTFALVGAFGFFVLNVGLGEVLGEVDGRYRAVSLMNDAFKLRNRILQVPDWEHLEFSVQTAALIVVSAIAVSLLVIARRLRKLEVVA